MSVITEIARPKVNLSLAVSSRRQDGYHEINSLIAFATSLGDIVRLALGGKGSLRVSGPFADAIGGENLIMAALAQLTEAEPAIELGSIMLEKRLPVAAGLGGGSADAAAVLRAIRRANPMHAEAVDWHRVAASLGADVPVCLADAPAFVTGVGDNIEAIPSLPRLPAILVNPMVAIPADKTAKVFSRLAVPPTSANRQAKQSPGPFRDFAALVSFMRESGNDLLQSAITIVPEIEIVRDSLAATESCYFVGLSGAGPTCFGIFECRAAVSDAADVLRQAHPRWWIAETELG